MGLLEPIVVCPAEKEGKYEILTGQRRFLAHKQLGRTTIRATVRPDRVDEAQAKALSLTENLVRRDLHTRDLIDACTSLFKKYGTLAAVADETGLPYPKVALYVKYDRLQPELRELVDSNKVPLKTALRAHDAASVSGEYSAEEAVRYAKEMTNMSGAQQERIVKKKTEDPFASADEIIESAKTRRQDCSNSSHAWSTGPLLASELCESRRDDARQCGSRLNHRGPIRQGISGD